METLEIKAKNYTPKSISFSAGFLGSGVLSGQLKNAAQTMAGAYLEKVK